MSAVQPVGVWRSSPSGLADVIDTILDKGLVIDIYVRVAVVGIELLTIDIRIVVASVDTYLRFAEAVNRLDLAAQKKGLPELMGDLQQGGARHKTKGAIEGVEDKLHGAGEKLREMAGSGSGSGSGNGRTRRRRGEDD
jgi:hypothetical protein